MAQRRMLSRRIAQSKKVNALSLKAQIIYTWVIPFLDDFGCYTGDPEDIKTEVFPKNKKITEKDIEIALNQMQESNLIWLYKVNNGIYLQYQNFNDFQTFRQDRNKQSEYPCHTKDNQCQPMTTNDICKLSKDKLSKDKLIKDQQEPTAVFSKEFVEKAKNAKEKGFNIYILINKFYKESKLSEKLPEEVLIGVLDTYLSNGEVKDAWPYFMRVLTEKSKKHFANRQEEEGEKYKKNVSNISDILKKMM